MQTGMVNKGTFKAVTRPSGNEGRRGQQPISMETRWEMVRTVWIRLMVPDESNILGAEMQCHGTPYKAQRSKRKGGGALAGRLVGCRQES